MHSKLTEILKEKQKEVDRLKKEGLLTKASNRRRTIRDFKGAICRPGRINLIAEIKFASPSAGPIREKQDARAIGRIYEQAGAAAISLITDKRFFDGDLGDLPPLKESTHLPILRKDFIVDEVQVKESFLNGADAILLIASTLSKQQLVKLQLCCRELGIAALVEVHDEDDLEKAIDADAEIIGINNRDLNTFEVDLATTLKLAPLVPEKCILVSESGISHGNDVRLLKTSRVQAVLVGSSIMKNDDIAGKTRELVEAGINLRQDNRMDRSL